MIILEYIFIFLAGILTGTYLNTCINRLSHEEGAALRYLHCTSCGIKLDAFDVTMFGRIFLKGRCRHCNAAFSIKYTLVELLTGAVFIAEFTRYGISVEAFAAVYLMSILIAVFFIDMKHKIIPDQLVIAGMFGAIALVAYNFFYPEPIFGEASWVNRLLGVLPGTGVLILVAVAGAVFYKTDSFVGMGDIKLYAPIGLMLGWKLCVLNLVLAMFAAGFAGIFLIVTGRKKGNDIIPFGPFIVVGTLIALIWGTEIVNWYTGSFNI